jgi:amino acid transporter
MKSTFWKVWGIPVIIGICSAVGLLSALTGDGFFDLLSWISLGVPVALTIWYLLRSKKRTTARRM